MDKPKKFLIGQLGCFGDCLYATTIAKQIKHDYPNSHVTWAVHKKYKSILELNPHIDEFWIIENPDLYDDGWLEFENEALRRKKQGIFDEVIFSQIGSYNFIRFDGTIRSTILNAYKNKITVDASPVIRLSDKEVETVKIFAERNNLSKYKHVVLFECSPGSGQSNMNFDLALEISKEITKNNSDVCFVLSTLNEIEEHNPQIISAKALSFRENAELTKYCTLLLGCSSGITWLSTSDWAKKLPTIQVLNDEFYIFAGVSYDSEKCGKSLEVVELLNPNKEKIISCLENYFSSDIQNVKSKFHEIYRPSLQHFYMVRNGYLKQKYGPFKLYRFAKSYHKRNPHLDFAEILKIAFKITNLQNKKNDFMKKINKNDGK
ncbi:hypothetical protein J4771_10170 [Candidatus Kaistella beijingensis]|uniref:glycosyltransferase family 9 protein n=1 Tax=Candidatus Kaistella beijingensis TaxID=2820270 RepID=UPI001CC4ED09|nr:hypothetical protein [Candidatus Kaistella beijingensis]UBB89228.1 hypothetical protein J4771_10170 [Candidatus Kaistella beijingensis]